MDVYTLTTRPLRKRLVDAVQGYKPAIQSICQATISIPSPSSSHTNRANDSKTIAKRDTCAAVSLAHATFLGDVRPARRYGRQPVRLRGIGGTDDDVLDRIGKFRFRKGNTTSHILCYVFDNPLAGIEKLCLIGMSDIYHHSIDILYHIGANLDGGTPPLQTTS